MTETLIRTVILYLCVVTVMRILGKRQIGEMQPNELVVTILISELAAIPMQDLNRPVSNGILAIFTLAILEMLISVLALKSKKARRLLNGKPVFIIYNGVTDQKMMKRTRLTIDDLIEALRLAGVFRIENVAYAVLETNGRLSVLQKAENLPATAGDMNLPAQANTLPAVVISDGILRRENFPVCGMNEEKLRHALTTRRLKPKDIFLMTADSNDQYQVIKKEA